MIDISLRNGLQYIKHTMTHFYCFIDIIEEYNAFCKGKYNKESMLYYYNSKTIIIIKL